MLQAIRWIHLSPPGLHGSFRHASLSITASLSILRLREAGGVHQCARHEAACSCTRLCKRAKDEKQGDSKQALDPLSADGMSDVSLSTTRLANSRTLFYALHLDVPASL